MTVRQTITLVAASVVLWIRPAWGAVTQPDGTTLPQPIPAAEISVVTSRGFGSSDDTLPGLFQSFAGGVDRGLDPVADASTTPGTFDPTCGLHISIVLKGDGCANALGWYNASQSTSPPPANKIYTVIPADLRNAYPNGISCMDGDFCPMASRDANPAQQGQHTWADPLPAFDPQIASNPNWQGGRVGFALIGNSGQCSQTKYSELALNVKSTQYGTPWITVLAYPSMAAAGAVYLAFESLPMDPSGWTKNGCDGDFNDEVYFVAPTPCAGGAGGALGVAGATGGLGGSSGGGAAGASGGTGASGAAGQATGGAAGASGGAGESGGATGGVSGSGGQNSSTGGQVATGGSPGTGGIMGAKPPVNGGGCGCQAAGSAPGAPVLGLVMVALAGLRRRLKSARIRRA